MNYRLGDSIRFNNVPIISNSFSDLYYKDKRDIRFDFELLYKIIINSDYLACPKNSMVFHFRLFDWIDWPNGKSIELSSFERFFKNYEQKISQMDKIFLLYGGTNKNKNNTEITDKFINDIIDHLNKYNKNIEILRGNNVEQDFKYMVTSEYFVPSVGGFSNLAAALNKNKVFWDISDFYYNDYRSKNEINDIKLFKEFQLEKSNYKNIIKVSHNYGFFSCCTIRLSRIVDYINSNKKLIHNVDSSDSFGMYKQNTNTDITFDYFEHYDNIKNPEIPLHINYNHTHQGIDYSNLDYIGIAPLIRKYFSPSVKINEIINNLEKKYNLNYENTIAVYYRGTDKFEETLLEIPFDTFYKQIMQIINLNKSLKILIQSDSAQFIDYINGKNVKNTIIFDENDTSYSNKGIHRDPKTSSNNYYSIFNFLSIVIIISRCKYIICNSGNCSLWMMLYRGNSNNVIQNLNGKWCKLVFHGQAEQDKFVLNILKNKTKGFFLEIGSGHPININNSYILERNYNWRGIMIEISDQWLNDYKNTRPNSIHIINDATKIDYYNLFETNNVPLNIDYLQIDLEASNGSTLNTLKKLDNEVMDKYKFSTITIEHNCKEGLSHIPIIQQTRFESREILKKRGYICVFEDIHNKLPKYVYEDWYVHPDLVDMDYINDLIRNNRNKYVNNIITNKSINWEDIEY